MIFFCALFFIHVWRLFTCPDRRLHNELVIVAGLVHRKRGKRKNPVNAADPKRKREEDDPVAFVVVVVVVVVVVFFYLFLFIDLFSFALLFYVVVTVFLMVVALFDAAVVFASKEHVIFVGFALCRWPNNGDSRQKNEQNKAAKQKEIGWETR